MAGWIVNAVGTAGALCSMASFTPQLLKIWRDKEAEQVSLRMYAVTVTGFSLWIAYGLLLKSWPLLLSNAVCLVEAAAILALTWRYGRKR
jgi:MtN3 and saliva related transmembrane protein